LATPLLVPLIEEGQVDRKIMAELIADYLSRPELQEIAALILACTHYPLIKQHVEDFYQHKTAVLDSSEITARVLKAWLEYHNLINRDNASAQKRFYVSDCTSTFTALTKLFFHEEVRLEQYPLWE
jgi:glutamate racemase